MAPLPIAGLSRVYPTLGLWDPSCTRGTGALDQGQECSRLARG